MDIMGGMDDTQFSVMDEIQWVILAMVLAGFAIVVGRKLGFFARVEKGPSKAFPTFFQTCLIFGLFLSCQLIARSTFSLRFFPSMQWMTVWMVIIAFGLLGGYLFILWDQVGYLFSTKRWRRDLLVGGAGWLIALPVILLVSHLVTLGLSIFMEPVPVEQLAVQELKTALKDPSLFTAMLGVVVIGAPLIEETLFRGFLQTSFVRLAGAHWGIAITSLIFTLFHFSPDQGISNVEILSSLFVLSCFLGYLRERQGNLWGAISLHCCFNSLSAFLILAE